MRTELANYKPDHPSSPWMARASRFFQRIYLYFFYRRVQRLDLGSPNWHRMQEKLSHASSIGLDQLKRNAFLSQTLTICGKNLFVHPLVIFYYPMNIRIGDNVFINRGAYFMAPVPVSIGNNVLIGPYTMFNSSSHIYSSRNKLIDMQGHKYGEIVIEDDVWIGGNVCILPGVTVGKGSVVGAGAVVTKSIEPYTVVAGVPARPIGVRDGA